MAQAVALANNDVVLLAWSYDEKIPGCLGFAIYRMDADGESTALPAWIGFQGEDNPDWDPSTTERWPVQKFSWRDLTAERGGTYSYEIVPMRGEPGQLEPMEDRRLKTKQVALSSTRSEHVRAFFNRGILSTQALARALPKDEHGFPSTTALREKIEKPGDRIRETLAGEIIAALSLLPKRAREDGGRAHGALYELKDEELVGLLEDPEHIALVLANAGEGDSTNHDARELLHEENVPVTDRILGGGHIGHNKFVVYTKSDGSAEAVTTGSTNWTSTGLCAQANNAILVADRELAEAYLDFWGRLKEESPQNGDEHATQSDAMRAKNDELAAKSIEDPFEIDGAEVRLCLSPNTEKHRKPKLSENPARPTDLAEVFDLIEGAKKAIFFLVFQPGEPSILDAIVDKQSENPKLFVRGAATDRKAIEKYDTVLFHRIGDHPEVAAAEAFDRDLGPFQKELLKSSTHAHAVIHDKIVVIDPMSKDCVVITGSHNLGYSASYANDENMLIVKGHRSLAEAYATHVMDIYDHYRWRYRQHHPDRVDASPAEQCGDGSPGLKTDDCWQSKYFDDPEAAAEREFWVSG
jgi:phosphatidylserine/phosphatidylglycerophosphate/cardiolipin synthase-like enzyme